MYTVTKEFKFEAAHSLPHLPEGHKCCRQHGHSYRVRIEVDGEPDARGMVMDYADISAAVKPIIATMDHYDLNDVMYPRMTTAENLAKWIYDAIDAEWVSRVVVFETADTSVVYAP